MLMEIRTILAAIENPYMSKSAANKLLHNVGVMEAVTEDKEKKITIKNVRYEVALQKWIGGVRFKASPVE